MVYLEARQRRLCGGPYTRNESSSTTARGPHSGCSWRQTKKENQMPIKKSSSAKSSAKKPQVKVSDLKASKDVKGGRRGGKKGGKVYNAN